MYASKIYASNIDDKDIEILDIIIEKSKHFNIWISGKFINNSIILKS